MANFVDGLIFVPARVLCRTIDNIMANTDIYILPSLPTTRRSSVLDARARSLVVIDTLSAASGAQHPVRSIHHLL